MPHACNPRTQEMEAGLLRIQGQPGLPRQAEGQPAIYSKTLSQTSELPKKKIIYTYGNWAREQEKTQA